MSFQYYCIRSVLRGVARVMNMCTHNARVTDLQSFSETVREWISPYSWLRAAQRTRWGVRGASLEENLKKDRKWWHLMVFAVKILIYKF